MGKMKVKEIKSNRYNLVSAINKLNYKIMIEVGVSRGGFSKFILENSNIKKLFSVDSYGEMSIEQMGWRDEIKNFPNFASRSVSLEDQKANKNFAIKNLKNFKERSELVHMDSLEFARNILKPNFADIVFLDGNHAEDYVYEELNLYFEKLKVHGLLSGHDYGGDFGEYPRILGVKKAVQRFCKSKNLDLLVTKKNFCFTPPNCFVECVESFFIYKK